MPGARVMTNHPPIIRYWHDENLPDEIEELFASVGDHNGSMQHLVFSEETAAALIEEHFTGRELAAFRACAVPAMQANYFRLCAVHALGGVYCDADIRLSGSVSPLLTTEGRLFHGSRFTEIISNHVFAFRAPGSPLLKLAIEIATANTEARSYERMALVNGPWVFTWLTLLWRLGSFEAFFQRMREMDDAHLPIRPRDEWLRYVKFVCTAIDGYPQVAEAFDGVRISSIEELSGIVVTQPRLQYKQGENHWQNWQGSIFR